MGGYARDIDPDGWKTRQSRINRALTLKDRLSNMPLSAFLVGDLPLLNRLNSDRYSELPESDYQRLEKRAEEYEARQKQSGT